MTKTLFARGVVSAVLTLALVLGVSGVAFPAGGKQDQTLTISVRAKDQYLEMAVARFEELNPGVKVEVIEYTSNPLPAMNGGAMVHVMDDPGEIEKYVRAMNTQLMSGRSSDIILLDDLPYETYADRHLLVDLGELMEFDASFDESKFYQNILEAVRYKGNLYGLPLSISIDFMIANKTLLENAGVTIEDDTWNWADFVRIAEEVVSNHPDQGLYALLGMDERQLIGALVEENYGKLVDLEAQAVHFTSSEFVDLLHLSKYLIDHNLVNPELDQAYAIDLALRGMVAFRTISLRGLTALQAAKSAFSDDVELLMPPGSDGKIGFSVHSMYGISSKSRNKELAWEFLKFLVSDEMMLQRSLAGIPIKKSVFPIIAEDAMTSKPMANARIMMKTPDSSYSQSITLQPLTAEDITFVENLLSKASIYKNVDQKIISIVQDEVAAFFTGQKTAEETAKLIQERVGLYLHE